MTKKEPLLCDILTVKTIRRRHNRPDRRLLRLHRSVRQRNRSPMSVRRQRHSNDRRKRRPGTERHSVRLSGRKASRIVRRINNGQTLRRAALHKVRIGRSMAGPRQGDKRADRKVVRRQADRIVRRVALTVRRRVAIRDRIVRRDNSRERARKAVHPVALIVRRDNRAADLPALRRPAALRRDVKRPRNAGRKAETTSAIKIVTKKAAVVAIQALTTAVIVHGAAVSLREHRRRA